MGNDGQLQSPCYNRLNRKVITHFKLKDIFELVRMNGTDLYTKQELASHFKVHRSNINFYLKMERSNPFMISDLIDKQQAT